MKQISAGRSALPTFAIAVALCVCMSGGPATAGESELWNFDITTTGNDVFWTSPTAVDNAADQYEGAYEITLVTVTGTWQSFPVGSVDVTNEIPPEFLSGGDLVDGPPPIELLNNALAYPPPPEEPSVAADVLIYLDESGFGQVEVTNVTLGTVQYDFGIPIGVQDIQITSIRVVGSIEVTPLSGPGIPGDLNDDGAVNVTDLLLLLGEWGACADCGNCPADLDGNCNVNVADLLLLLANWG